MVVFQFSQLLQLLISGCLIREVKNDPTVFTVSHAVENGVVDIKQFSLKMEFIKYSEAPVCRINFPMAVSYFKQKL